jgi:hypothetical protein
MKTLLPAIIASSFLGFVPLQSLLAQSDNDHIRNCVQISHEAVMNRDCAVPSRVGRPEQSKTTDRAQTSYFDPVDCRNQINDDMEMCLGMIGLRNKPETTTESNIKPRVNAVVKPSKNSKVSTSR